ncbi:MAG TPA: hypothetical protein VNY31_09730 [Solirubrobacteraceae bacterium]|jgi:hypothetical protein|nr:hypothetical protein [Solirubrobacteraceae bacterium]
MIPTATPGRAFVAVALAIAALALSASGPAPLDTLGVSTAAAQAPAAPPPSPSPGYFAQAVCSHGTEPVGAEYWLAIDALSYPMTFGHLDTCEEPGGSLTLRDEGAHDSEPESGPSYVYQAPPGSLIAGGVIELSMTSPGGKADFSVERQKTGREVLASCEQQSCTGTSCKQQSCTEGHSTTVSIPDTEWWLMFAKTVCKAESGQAKCSTSGVNAELSITTATILLHSKATPEATGLTGSLTESPVSGTANVTFTAHETNGPGVYRVTADINGEEAWAATPNTEYGQCVAHGTYEGALTFHNAQPCPQEVPVRIELPTTSFGDGPHLVEVAIEDAAGNRSVVFDKTIAFQNHPGATSAPVAPATSTAPGPPERGSCNGSPCDDAAKLSLAMNEPKSVTRALGHSALTLTGRLTTPTGAPIKDAQIKLLQQIVGSAATTLAASTTTSSTGAWKIKAANGPSRLLQVAYYSHTLDTIPAATLDVHESVQGAVSMHAPHRARLGRAVIFTGQLLGGYVPPSGESVQVEIFYGGRWRTIEVLPTTSKGRWTYKYVFTLGAGTSYLFRAATVPDGVYPYLSTHSKPVRVTVQR